ncbi:restriction endonuclease subunit S [Streptomyces sp. NPDC057249]|uniref:restriction endonuclease subunit S n=1 Tax=Streptomyces sp. NPDC057249 TaxID=3346067 RepID=UPI003636561F
MSRISGMLQEFSSVCVEYRALGHIGEFIRGQGLQKADLRDEGVPAVHYGQLHTSYGVWATETKSFTDRSIAAKLRHAKPGDLLIATTSEDDDAVGKATAWLGDSDVVLSGDAYIFRHGLDPKYVSYFFQSASFQKQKRRFISGTKVRRISGDSLSKILIPTPPIDVQREIARVLDQFSRLETELAAELKAELKARRHQYEHYRARMLAEAAHAGEKVALGEIGRIVTGRTPKSSDAAAWGTEVDFITPSDIANGMKMVSAPGRRLSAAGVASMAKAVVPEQSLLVTCIGADMGKTVINEHECVTNQQINSIIPTRDIVVDYFYHLLTSMRDGLRTQGERSGGTMPLINKTDFSKIEVPVPSVAVQEAVASKLNDLSALINEVGIGLSGELKARRKQYEHYRDLLLTPKEAVA